LIIGIILAFIPEFYANKRQATLSYGLICIGSVFLCLLIFVYIDKVKQKDAKYLQAFGRNPFLTYFVAELIWQISDLLILDGMSNEERVIPQAIIIVILVVVTSLMNVYLYKREKILRTEKAIVLFFIVTVILGVLLL
ncbi:MAG: hypothetical protein GY870_12755, partial [archaeon]|nr:hypothetical protein [archaeon]